MVSRDLTQFLRSCQALSQIPLPRQSLASDQPTKINERFHISEGSPATLGCIFGVRQKGGLRKKLAHLNPNLSTAAQEVSATGGSDSIFEACLLDLEKVWDLLLGDPGFFVGKQGF